MIRYPSWDGTTPRPSEYDAPKMFGGRGPNIIATGTFHRRNVSPAMARDGIDGITDAAGRYLVAAFRRWADVERRVTTGEVADRVGVKPASVTGMFRRLGDAGLLDYEPNRGVVPTRDGADLARELSRRACLIEGLLGGIDTDRALAIGRRLPADAIERAGGETGHRCRDRCRIDEAAFERCPEVSADGVP